MNREIRMLPILLGDSQIKKCARNREMLEKIDESSSCHCRKQLWNLSRPKSTYKAGFAAEKLLNS